MWKEGRKMSVNWVYEKVNKEFQFFKLKLGPRKHSPTPLKNPWILCVWSCTNHVRVDIVRTRMKHLWWYWANICWNWWKFKMLRYDHSWQLCVLNWLKDKYLSGIHLRFAFSLHVSKFFAPPSLIYKLTSKNMMASYFLSLGNSLTTSMLNIWYL